MKKLLVIINAALLVCAALFILVAILVAYNNKAVDAVGKYAVHKYEKYHKKQHKYAIEELRDDNADDVIELLEDWDKIKKGDRIYPLKRNMPFSLSSWLRKNKRFAEMLYWTEIWNELDDRDVTGKAFLAEAIRNTPGRKEEGITLLGEQWRRFSKNQTLKNFYRNAVGEQEYQASLAELDLFAVAEEVDSSKKNQSPVMWGVYWDTGAGFNKEESTVLAAEKKDDYWVLSGVLSSEIKRLRFDPPGSALFKFRKLKLTIDHSDIDVDLDDVKLNMMARDKKWLIMRPGPDPYFHLDVSNYVDHRGDAYQVEVSMKFKMLPLNGESPK